MSEYADDRRRTAGWFIWLVRLALVAGAAICVWYALDLHAKALVESAAAFAPIETAKYWEVFGLLAAGGFAFCVALRIPFPRPRIAWGRVVFAILASLPALHLWAVVGDHVGSVPAWVRGPYWFDAAEAAHIGAVLAGVALASGIGARRRI